MLACPAADEGGVALHPNPVDAVPELPVIRGLKTDVSDPVTVDAVTLDCGEVETSGLGRETSHPGELVACPHDEFRSSIDMGKRKVGN